MGETVYFSFDEADRDVAQTLAGRAGDPTDPVLAFRVKDPPHRFGVARTAIIRQAVERALQGTDRTIVLVGEDTWRSPWVREEVLATLETGRPVCAIRLSDGAGPRPPCLAVHDIPVHPWSEEALQELATAPADSLAAGVDAPAAGESADGW